MKIQGIDCTELTSNEVISTTIDKTENSELIDVIKENQAHENDCTELNHLLSLLQQHLHGSHPGPHTEGSQ